MQSKLRLLHLSDLLRSAAARGSSCLKLKSCSQSFLGEDDCQRLQWLVGCSAPQLLPATVFIKFITSQPESDELGKEQKRQIQTHRQFFCVGNSFHKVHLTVRQTWKGKDKNKEKKAKNTCLLRRSSICIGIINLYLYLYYQFVFVFVLSICICICRCS